jgi:hypothetical protein
MIRYIENILDIQGSYLYRIVGLDTLLTYLKNLKIPKNVSWTRDSRLNYIVGMEDVSCAKLTMIKDRLKAIGIKFKPVAEPDYPKSKLSFESEEVSLSFIPMFYGSTPMISIELWDVFMNNPESLAVNKMGNDRWRFTNDIDFKLKKKRNVQYYTGILLSKAYETLQEYCNKYPQLFVKNKVYSWIKSGQWVKDLFKNDSTANNSYLKIRKKILQAYFASAESDKYNSAISKLSNREKQKYGSEFSEFNIMNFTIGEYKYLFKNNPYFRAIIYDSEDLDLYRFFRLDIKNIKAQSTMSAPYLKLLHILSIKIKYDKQSENIPHIQDLGMGLLFEAYGTLPYIKGMYLTNKPFRDWISKLKVNTELELLLRDASIKPKYYTDNSDRD